jgi:hypothetical protein
VHRRNLLLVAFSALVAGGVVGCGSSTLAKTRDAAARVPPIPQLTASDKREIVYIGRASQIVFNDHKKCLPSRQGMHRVRDDGSPSQVMLSSFAVLKLPTKAALPVDLPGYGQKAYVNYVRIAQTRFGWPFKIIPLAHFTTESSRCHALEASEVQTLITHAPAKVRAKVDAIEHDLQLDYRYVERHPEGICVSGYHGESTCETLLYAIERGAISPSGIRINGNSNLVSFDLVPNGVARITIRYPKQPGSPAHTINVQVIHNLAVWKMAGEGGSTAPTILWHAADGRTMRTIPADL